MSQFYYINTSIRFILQLLPVQTVWIQVRYFVPF